MSVDYNRARCEQFVERLLEAPPTIVALVWARLAFNTQLVAAGIHTAPLIEEWETLSLWNRQAILYMLAPHIERIACARAHAVEQEAREKEPL